MIESDLLCAWRGFKKIFVVNVDIINETFDQSIASTKTKYIKLNTKTQIVFFNNIRLLYTL